MIEYGVISGVLRDFAADRGVIAGVCAADGFAVNVGRSVLPAKQTPAEYLEGFCSIFAIGVGYNKVFRFQPDDRERVALSKIAIGIDYHVVVNGYLSKLVEILENIVSFRYKIHVDNGPLPERAIAAAAGLGYVGRNQCLISERFGSFFNIGLLATDIAVEGIPAFGVGKGCLNCGRCVESCPGGALDGAFNHERCASYITQKKGELTQEETDIARGKLYGCDVCQDVCPLNVGKETVADITDIDAAMPLAADICAMDEAAFRARFGATAAAWRGLEALRRNAKPRRDATGSFG